MKYKLLSETEVEQIHEASIKILQETGIEVPHQQMLELFKEAGAKVQQDSQIVKIPERLINRSLGQTSKEFTLFGRDSSNKARFGVGARNYNSSAGQAYWKNEEAGKRRKARLQDVAEAASIADGLDKINIVGAMADPPEMDPSYRPIALATTLLKNTTKPITLWFTNSFAAKYVLKVFEIVAGGKKEVAKRPFAYPFLEPVSPLRFNYDGIDILFETCKFPLPVPIGPMAQTGATAPGTLVGTMIQENAEILAGIVITQLINPGTPVMYGGIPHAFDMRSAQIIFGGPEQSLMAVAMSQMGQHYELPVYINVGATDSKQVDAQAGLEAGITLTLGALTDADIFGHLGIAGVDQAASLDMLVMQNELIGYVERLKDGVSFSDYENSLELINSVGLGGSYISKKHTVDNFRKELWFPELLDRSSWESWEKSGRLELKDRCANKRRELLKNHEPKSLSSDVVKELNKVLEAARKELKRG